MKNYIKSEYREIQNYTDFQAKLAKLKYYFEYFEEIWFGLMLQIVSKKE